MMLCYAKNRMPSLLLDRLIRYLFEGKKVPLPSVQSLYYVELKSSLHTRLAPYRHARRMSQVLEKSIARLALRLC
jgi:hypothetical protein